ncbi:methyltransferase-like protein 16 [Ananas comosus]|uniref:U6 small nuclear RNA (adenine-(43)-N(6))-methyltransferase n=1 Tax=Ananas comosus TaxID=4615 RepID=A0A6P5EE23_ANACO|nr:methyltransferase-like protein 16 [Ananas comosus]
MPSKKRPRPRPRRRGVGQPPAMHPRNRYTESPPDFALLASLYPSLRPFVSSPSSSSSSSSRASIDWTDPAATRELSRVLLLHDHGVHWWIPDGQLCPTVPNRSNYIHWIEDLLASDLIPESSVSDGRVRGFDIGTGANCIYPLLGASLLGWSFVGSDVTDVALEWAKRNVESNPHLAELIEVRNANDSSSSVIDNTESLELESKKDCYCGPPILLGVVKDGESFDFCMCNPPFFESIEVAGLNPKTSCGGTAAEMVCSGGERAFITRIIKDSVSLKHSFRWFTSMVGRKVNLKFLVSKAHEVGASVVKTTEFVQGQTARWGLAWSFLPPTKKFIAASAQVKNHSSFMLEGLQRQIGAFQILKSVESFFIAIGASCKSDLSTFCVNVTISDEQTCNLSNSDVSNKSDCATNGISFRVSVFEQIPGTLLVKGSSLQKENLPSGLFSSLFSQLEEALKTEFVHKSP